MVADDAGLDGTDDRKALLRALADERAAAGHWRATATDRQVELLRVRRRPVVRVAERLERFTQSVGVAVPARLRRRSRPVEAGRSGGFVFTVGAPLAKVASRWGDWHLAAALAGELERGGHPARVQSVDALDGSAAPADDVHVVVRGLAPVQPAPGERQVLWIISHPETITGTECDDADLVLVASERFAVDLRARTSTPVEVFLQATDHRRFHPVAPVAQHRHDVTVVAKSRDVLRPMVADAITAGIRPAIYGGGWRELVDPTLVVADHVDNAELPSVYCSAGVVLNDHWEAMRERGFVSNRVFDVLACGVPLLSDDLPELGELFGDLVTTWGSPDQLAAEVASILGDRTAAAARAASARAIVLGAHTFEVRARQLIGLLAEHGLVPSARRSA